MSFINSSFNDNNEYEFRNGALILKQPDNFSVIKEKGIRYTRQEETVFVSSSSRDTSVYPLHYDYKINFDRPYKNVKRVEIVSVVLPNVSGILDEPVVVFDINELNYIDFPSSSGYKKVFAVLPIQSPNKATDGFINLTGINTKNSTTLEYKTPVALLAGISVKIRDITGALYNFGAANGSVLKKEQHHFILKITTEEKTRESLQSRNVY